MLERQPEANRVQQRAILKEFYFTHVVTVSF